MTPGEPLSSAELWRLEKTVELRDKLIEELVAQLEHARGGTPRHAEVLRAVDDLLARVDRFQVAMCDAEARLGAAGAAGPGDPVVAVRDVVRRHVPPGATVAVAGDGDDALIDLPRCRGRHFDPPASAEDLVASVHRARAAGAAFLAVPRSSSLWSRPDAEAGVCLAREFLEVHRSDTVVLYSLGERFLPHHGHTRSASGHVTAGLVSIVFPIHNGIQPEHGDRWLRETIHPLTGALRDRAELIIVDDGSVDGTGVVLRDYDDIVPITVVRLSRWRGTGAALNVGIEASAGEFVARISVGDRWSSGKLDRQLELLESGAADVVGSAVQLLDGAGRPRSIQSFPESHDEIRDALARGRLAQLPLAPPAVVMRRTVWQEVGGYSNDPAFRFAEDHEFLVRAAATGARFANVEEALYEYRLFPARVSQAPLTRTLHRQALLRIAAARIAS